MRISKRLNLIVNIGLAFAVLVCIGSFGWRYLSESNFAAVSLSPDGKKLKLSGVDFSTSSQTVLLVLDKDCGACKKEGPFYRRLINEARSKGVNVIAAFEHDLDAGKNYLSNLDLEVSGAVRVHMASLEVRGTPTLLLVNRDGETLGRWVGTLSDDLHDYILGILGVSDETIRNDGSAFFKMGNLTLPPTIAPTELLSEMREGPVTVLDVDDRDEFAVEHIAGAINIPDDEVYARSKNELPASDVIIVFSRRQNTNAVSNARVSLADAGYSNIQWLNAPLQDCKAAGFEPPLRPHDKGGHRACAVAAFLDAVIPLILSSFSM